MAPDVTYAYDNLGRLVQAAQPGQTLAFTFDALGRTLSQAGPLGTVSAQYDLASRRTRLTWPDGLYAAYEYDLTDAVTAIRETGAATGPGVLASYVYDDLGRRVSVARGNGTSTAYAYDAAQRLLTLTHDLAGAAQDQSYRLTYNALGQNLQRVGSNAAYAWPAPALGTTPYARNGLDQYTSVGAATPTYDSRGNLTGDGVAAYGYDALNRLTAAPGGASLGYDPLDRLAQITIGTAATRFLQDGNEVIGEYDAGGALLRRYVPGPALDEPIVWYEGSGTSDRRWLLADPLGSVIAVTNAAGTASAINSYDAYGQPGASNTGRFGYAGALALPEAGLLSLRARAYDPVLGRFLQTDPILTAGGINLYAYVGNDPINAVDPSGLVDPFVAEIIVHGYRWYEDPNFQARRDQLNAQQMTRDLQGVGGSASGETSDPKSDIITVIGQRPGPAIVGAPPPVLYAGGTQTTQQYLQCVADTANTGGLAGAAIAGAAAIAAGTRIIPYSAVAGRSGLNPAGRTSIISAASRGFFRGTLGPGPVNDALASIAGTRSVGGVVGRLTARTSVGIGIVLESYSAGRVIGGALRCMQ